MLTKKGQQMPSFTIYIEICAFYPDVRRKPLLPAELPLSTLLEGACILG